MAARKRFALCLMVESLKSFKDLKVWPKKVCSPSRKNILFKIQDRHQGAEKTDVTWQQVFLGWQESVKQGKAFDR